VPTATDSILYYYQALVHARLADTYAQIDKATYGIVFFGTPHGGGNNAKVGSLAADIAKFLAHRDDNSFMEALKKNSFYGEQNRDDFLHLAKDFAFLSFYEANPTRKFKVGQGHLDIDNMLIITAFYSLLQPRLLIDRMLS
jgi:hypothetical protein